MKKKHYCPICKKEWECDMTVECGSPYECLCDWHDTHTNRKKLGGKWLE